MYNISIARSIFSNFRRACNQFRVTDGWLTYLGAVDEICQFSWSIEYIFNPGERYQIKAVVLGLSTACYRCLPLSVTTYWPARLSSYRNYCQSMTFCYMSIDLCDISISFLGQQGFWRRQVTFCHFEMNFDRAVQR